MRFDPPVRKKMKFALNINIKFYDREECFSFDPRTQSLPINANLALSSMRHRIQLVFSSHQ